MPTENREKKGERVAEQAYQAKFPKEFLRGFLFAYGQVEMIIERLQKHLTTGNPRYYQKYLIYLHQEIEEWFIKASSFSAIALLKCEESLKTRQEIEEYEHDVGLALGYFIGTVELVAGTQKLWDLPPAEIRDTIPFLRLFALANMMANKLHELDKYGFRVNLQPIVKWMSELRKSDHSERDYFLDSLIKELLKVGILR